ncbi:aspartate kinase, partial [Escherichia coli]|nr:aspartate kinase [Escherichia coli]
IKRVARRIIDTKSKGHDVVVVVSAMGDTTDDLLDLAGPLTDDAPAREMDMLLSAGERISMSLLAMAINQFGEQAASFTGSQAGLITDSTHGKARIMEVSPQRVRRAIDRGFVA